MINLKGPLWLGRFEACALVQSAQWRVSAQLGTSSETIQRKVSANILYPYESGESRRAGKLSARADQQLHPFFTYRQANVPSSFTLPPAIPEIFFPKVSPIYLFVIWPGFRTSRSAGRECRATRTLRGFEIVFIVYRRLVPRLGHNKTSGPSRIASVS